MPKAFTAYSCSSPAPYELTFEAPGFKRLVQGNVVYCKPAPYCQWMCSSWALPPNPFS
jgi:hypothetical protein